MQEKLIASLKETPDSRICKDIPKPPPKTDGSNIDALFGMYGVAKHYILAHPPHLHPIGLIPTASQMQLTMKKSNKPSWTGMSDTYRLRFVEMERQPECSMP